MARFGRGVLVCFWILALTALLSMSLVGLYGVWWGVCNASICVIGSFGVLGLTSAYAACTGYNALMQLCGTTRDISHEGDFETLALDAQAEFEAGQTRDLREYQQDRED